MQVFDEVTGTFMPENKCVRVMVKHLPDLVILGYSSNKESIVNVWAYTHGNMEVYSGDKELLKGSIEYSQNKGVYFSTVNLTEKKILHEASVKGQGEFPYSFERKYEAVENFDIFKNKQKILNKDKEYCLSSYLKYTFGVEFETSMGYIPEDLCFRDGLIPLRDGSISGLEYSTIVLNGNNGLALLEQELNTLRKYTAFNKECSLHVHLGNYPVDPVSIFRLQILCKTLEEDIANIVPRLTFNSSSYKDNGKDYCSKLRSYRSFETMYTDLVGEPFYGDLTQPHPNDTTRRAKWRIPTRYYWVNFINILCYKVNKTIEFRFLRPTYNFKKIELWLYIFNAILMYAEDVKNPITNSTNLKHIINKVYPPSVAQLIQDGICRLHVLVVNQAANNDYIGRDIEFEEELFPENLPF